MWRRPQEGVRRRGRAGQEAALLQEAQDVASSQRLVGGGGTFVWILGGVLFLFGAAVLEPNLHLQRHKEDRLIFLLQTHFLVTLIFRIHTHTHFHTNVAATALKQSRNLKCISLLIIFNAIRSSTWTWTWTWMKLSALTSVASMFTSVFLLLLFCTCRSVQDREQFTQECDVCYIQKPNRRIWFKH